MENELVNDAIWICKDCGEVIKAYTTSGEVKFCTNCSSRNLDGLDEED